MGRGVPLCHVIADESDVIGADQVQGMQRQVFKMGKTVLRESETINKQVFSSKAWLPPGLILSN